MAAEPEVEKDGPSQNGTFSAFKPQWRHDPTWGPAINERVGFKGGEKWTDVPVTLLRGIGIVVPLGDGREVPLGIPFPRAMPGILETIFMYGYEQAQALSWAYAASAQSVGATIEVRVKEYRVRYSINANAVIEPAHDGDPRT